MPFGKIKMVCNFSKKSILFFNDISITTGPKIDTIVKLGQFLHLEHISGKMKWAYVGHFYLKSSQKMSIFTNSQ